jgi:hypothetical protein
MIGSVWSLTRRLRLASSRNRLFDRLFRRRRDRLLERRYLDLVFRLGRSDFQRSLLSSRGRRKWSGTSLIGISRQTLQRGVDGAGRGLGRGAAATGTVGFLQARLRVADHAHESMTSRLRHLLLGALTALALLAAGCGGATTSGSGDTAGATLVRPDALVFVSFDTDLGSSQWKQVDALSKKFAGRDEALSQINHELEKNSVDYSRDIKPAVGPEVDLAIVPSPNLTDVAVVGLTKPEDAGKFKALVKKLNEQGDSGQPAVYREVNGWFALSDSQAHIDQVLKSGDKSLSDESIFNDALGKLPDEALVKAYVNGPQFGKLVQQLGLGKGNGLAASTPELGVTKLDFISAALSAEEDGIRLHGATGGEGSSSLASGDYESKLISGVPADALAFFSFKGGKSVDQMKEQFDTNPTFSQALPQIERELGVKVADILALLRGEVALYVRPGGAIPEVSLVLDTSDQAAALSTLDKLASRLASFTNTKVSTSRAEGRTVKTIDFDQFAIRYAGLGVKVLITSGLNGIGAYTSSDSKLSDSADFKEAKSAAGMPSSNSGFMYVDLKNSIALAESLSGLAGSSLPPQATENLKPLRSFVAWGERSGDAFTFDAFLEIK